MDDTRERLLRAAVEEFGDHGYEGATVRGICRRAGANIAAVNYHFGDKEHLYREAVQWACTGGVAYFEEFRNAVTGPTDPRDRLYGFVEQFLKHIVALGQEITARQKLIFREFVQPTPALDHIVQEVIRPRFEQLRDILRELRPDLDSHALYLTAFSIIGQCKYYRMAAPVVNRLLSRDHPEGADLGRLADHITQFSLNALGCSATPRSDGLNIYEHGGSNDRNRSDAQTSAVLARELPE